MTVTQCRACDSRDLAPVLDLGTTALAHRFVRPDQVKEPDSKFPLRCVLCNACGLVQLDEAMPEPSATEWAQGDGSTRMFIGRDLFARTLAPRTFAEKLRKILAADGIAVFEVPYLPGMHERVEFDVIHHQQPCYYTLGVLQTFFQSFQLRVVDAQRVDQGGSSLRIQVGHENGPQQPSARVAATLMQEHSFALKDHGMWKTFAERVARAKDDLLWFIETEALPRGLLIAGFGATPRGNTLLSYCNLDDGHMPFIVAEFPFTKRFWRNIRKQDSHWSARKRFTQRRHANATVL